MEGRISVALGFVLCGILACSIGVAANPGPYPSDGYDGPEDAIATIFILNIWTNLFWFSALLLLTCYVWKKGFDRVSKRISIFIIGVIAVAVVVTALGALVDYTLLLREYPFGLALYYDLLNWSVAVVLIFISVYASAMLVLKVSPLASILPAAGMAALNPIWWEITLNADFAIEFMTVAISLILIPVFLLGLVAWHHRRFPRKESLEPSASAGSSSG